MLQEADIGRATLIDEVAIVTGASSGIGAATARELALRGATVVLAARRADELEAQAQATRRAGGEALAIPTDVADPTQVTLLVDRTVATFGRVDVLVNNAGANWSRPLASSHPDDITGLLEVNLLGAMLLTRAVLPGMLERRHGAIISVGSLSGRAAMEPLYSATKYGVRGFSLALRRLFMRRNSRHGHPDHGRQRIARPPPGLCPAGTRGERARARALGGGRKLA